MIPMNPNLSGLQRSGIRVYTNLANEIPGCVKLTLGEPDFDTPQPIKDALCRALEAGQTHYAPNQGLLSLREAVADYETSRGFPCEPDRVLITVGATGALFTALLGVLAPGDEVIVPMPAFPLYESIATVAGAKVVALRTPDFQITREVLEEVITPRTKAIVLNSPNNPTGTVYTAESLAAVKAAVLGKPIYVVCDQVYRQLCAAPCPDITLDGALREQILLCQSFSKPYAMTGWRVGYLIGPGELIARLLLLHAAQVASVPTFVQTACLTALKTDVSAVAESYRKRKEYVCGRLKAMGLEFPAPDGAFYVFPDVSRFGLDSAIFCTRMIREAGVAAVPGSCFGCEGHIRISYCCAEDALREGLDRMEAFLTTL